MQLSIASVRIASGNVLNSWKAFFLFFCLFYFQAGFAKGNSLTEPSAIVINYKISRNMTLQDKSNRGYDQDSSVGFFLCCVGYRVL